MCNIFSYKVTDGHPHMVGHSNDTGRTTHELGEL